AGTCEPDLDRGRGQEVIPRLRDERDRQPGLAGPARWVEAGPEAHPLFDERAGPHARSWLCEVSPRGRRCHGQIPPARRPLDLRYPGADGAAVLDEPAAD